MTDKALELRWYVKKRINEVCLPEETLQWQTVEKIQIPSKGDGVANYSFMESGWHDIPVVYEVDEEKEYCSCDRSCVVTGRCTCGCKKCGEKE